jgi:NAD(P)-dependent dehydrogenase (short-subunit alcohol dehydrogenase family)
MGLLDGKIALVTGCGNPRGMGRATALKLGEQGATVIVSDICRADERLTMEGALKLGDDFTTLEALAAEIDTCGGKGRAMALDLLDGDRIIQIVKDIVEEFDRLDILVNNAGTAAGAGEFLELSDEAWDLSYKINILGVVRLLKQVIPLMQKYGGGSIINNASIMGISAVAGYGAYAATKHAIVGITKVVADEFAIDGIRCNAVCPGNIHTDMGEAEADMLVDLLKISREEAFEKLGEDAAMKRMGKPEEVADAIAYLAGPHSSFITGVAFPVTGGMRPGL